MEEIIHFTATDADDEADMLIRVFNPGPSARVGLTLTLTHDGNLEISFGLDQLEQIIQALERTKTYLIASQSGSHE